MYKVFIDNKPIIFQINPKFKQTFNLEEVWNRIHQFLASELNELIIQMENESAFFELFAAYKKVDAAGGLVQRKDGFLFIKRNGFWDIPKGKLEKGETASVGAVREIEEECGLIQPLIKTHLIDTWHTYLHKGKNVLKKTVWYWLEEGNEFAELKPQEEEGITALDYFKMNEWDQIRANTFQSILEVMDALEEKIKK